MIKCTHCGCQLTIRLTVWVYVHSGSHECDGGVDIGVPIMDARGRIVYQDAPGDLSSVAREAAEARYPLNDDLSVTHRTLTVCAREDFTRGFTECASRLPSENELVTELSKHKLVRVSVSRKAAFCRCNSNVKAGIDDSLAWFENHRARMVRELIEKKIVGG